jgi:D-3-phosphoglycerate dehydrogenase / 2-oxoglutarate reductase
MTERRICYVENLAHQTYIDVLEERGGIVLERIENAGADDHASSLLARAHIYQIGSARDDIHPKYHAGSQLLGRAPLLLAVSTSGAGYDTVDVTACTEAGVLAVNQAGGNREAVAEHVLGMMIGLSKRIMETDRFMRRAAGIRRNLFIGNDLHGKTIGIVGLGHVGSRIAELCRGLFAMPVLAYDPYLTAAEIARRGAEKTLLEELLRRADFVSINCPLTEETRNMIGAAQFALMQKHAYFINTARGGIHDEAALAAALDAKQLAGAGLDVWAKEPPPPDHPLLQFDNVMVSPHTAGVTRQARAHIARIAALQVLDILDGKRPSRLLNPEVWPVYAERFARSFGFVPGGAAPRRGTE